MKAAASTALSHRTVHALARRREGDGAQAVDRALALLLRLAVDIGPGMRLKDIAFGAGLDPATTHRLLGSLKRFGLVEQHGSTRRYSLGLEFFAVAAAASGRLRLSDSIRPALRDLSRRTGLSALFFVCSGADLVCVDMVAGTVPSAFGPHDLGTRQPIGAGAAGMAVLSALPENEIENLAVRSVRQMDVDPETAIRSMHDAIRRTQTEGHALAEDIAIGFLTLAMAIQGHGSRPEAALAVNGPSSVLSQALAADLLAQLAAQVQRIEAALASAEPALCTLDDRY